MAVADIFDLGKRHEVAPFKRGKIMKRRALIVGGSGQLGSELRRLREGNWDILAPNRAELDVADAAALKNAVETASPDIVLNFTAFHVVDLCEERFAEALSVNALAVSTLARATEGLKARFWTFSTDYVFDGARQTPYAEGDRPNPIQAYGISKLAGELAAMSANPEMTTIVRSCGLYGRASSRQKGGNFVLNRLADARRQSVVPVGSDLVCTPTSCVDLAKAVVEMIENDAPAGIYHLTNEGSCSWATFTDEIYRRAGLSTEVSSVDRRGRYGAARRPLYSVLDCAKAQAIGIAMRPWQDALADYLACIA